MITIRSLFFSASKYQDGLFFYATCWTQSPNFFAAIGCCTTASALNFSDRTLHRKLKALTAESPKNFITRVRIEMACLLLENPMTNIKQVAAECSYSEDTAFRRAFSQQMEMTPTQFRKWALLRNNTSRALDNENGG